MNVLFVYSVDDLFLPEKPLQVQEEMQFGISYISSLLKKQGHSTKLVVLSRMLGKRNNERLGRYIGDFKPSLICFSAVTSEYRFIANTAKAVKEMYPDIYLIAGGVHVSLNPDNVLSDGFDALCIGEGEYPVLELASQLSANKAPSGIQNLWIKQADKIEKNETAPFLQNINDLPFPDREMWQEWIEERGDSRYPILLGRGCPFQCTYCCNHALRRLAKGPYVRFRSIDNIISEIRSITDKLPGIKDFYLEVETIGANREWAMELCSGLEALNRTLSVPLSFGTNLRVTQNADFDDLFTAFKRANFKFIKIGVESGSERVRREILKREYSNDDIINTVRSAKKHGLEISFYNLIGVPGETIDDFKETVEINRLCLPRRAFAHIFFPYPGTELYSKCVEEGILKGDVPPELERCRAVLDLKEFPKKDIQKSFVWFDYYVYKGHMPMYKILAKVFISKCRSNIRLHYLYRTFTYSPLVRRIKSK